MVVPVDESPEKPSTLWQKLWLNVLPKEALNDSYSDIKKIGDVLPWMVATRTSDGSDGVETTPESVHPLQAYWNMPRRIRIDTSSIDGHGKLLHLRGKGCPNDPSLPDPTWRNELYRELAASSYTLQS